MSKTVLFEEHKKQNGHIVEYGEFEMPLYFSSIEKEHLKVREDAGVFDISHMGQIAVRGSDCCEYISFVTTADYSSIKDKTMRYALFLSPQGKIIDDVMIYRVNKKECLLVVNASNTKKDYINMLRYKPGFDIKIKNQSSLFSGIALQGINSEQYLNKIFDLSFKKLKYLEFGNYAFDNKKYLISRSGYTGSDGFEIFSSQDNIKHLYQKMMDEGIAPCGLGARDTLRFEAAMPLYGNEIDMHSTPLEAGLSFAVDLKHDFVGKGAILAQKRAGIERVLVGIELDEKGIARQRYPIYSGNDEIGVITTGYILPGKEKALALGYVGIKYRKPNTEIEIGIRKRRVKAHIRNKKFMDKHYKKEGKEK